MIAYNINTLLNSITYRIDNIIIDPGDKCNLFNNIEVVLLTHAHFDHIYGLNELCKEFPNILVYTNVFGRDMLANAKKNMSYYHETPFVYSYPDRVKVVDNREEIILNDNLTAKAIFTPGHNPSCITWIIKNCLFTGDAYIPGIQTVTNLPGGNKQQAAESIETIKKLAIGRNIYPGHLLL